jgi:hypothetical protein
VVDQWVSNVESSSPRDFLLLHDLWTTFRHLLWSQITSAISMAWDFTTKSGGICFFCTDLQATPEQILSWVVMRWSVEVTFEEARAHLGVETQRQWSDQAIARTTPVLLALFAIATVLALRLSQGGQIPVPVTAWYRKVEPTFADCLALVRWHLWRTRYLVNSNAEAELMQCHREALELLIHGFPVAA